MANAKRAFTIIGILTKIEIEIKEIRELMMGKHTFNDDSKKNNLAKPQMSRLVYREMQRMKDEQKKESSNKFIKFMSQFYLPDKQNEPKNTHKPTQHTIGKHVKMHNGKIVKTHPHKTYISLLIIFVVAFGIYCLKSSNVNSIHRDNAESSINLSSKSSAPKSSYSSSTDNDEANTESTPNSYYNNDSYSNSYLTSTSNYNRQRYNDRYNDYYSSNSAEYNNRYYNSSSAYSNHNYRRYDNDQQYSNSYNNQESQNGFSNNNYSTTEKD